MKQLMAGLTSTDLPEKSDLDATDDPAGFRRRFSKHDARIQVAVKPSIFNSWFVDMAHRQAALRWLHAKNLLLLRDGNTELPTGLIPTEAIVSFEKRPGEGRRENGRWIRFTEPAAAQSR